MPLAAFLAVAAGAFGAAPAEAQDGGRYRVLVPALAPEAGAKDKFGKDVADKVQDALDEFATHAPVESKVLKDALKKFGLKDDDLRDCIKARQLAVQIRAELVMCGSYTESGDTRQVTSAFYVPTTGEQFEVQPFSVTRPEEAAQQITVAFQTYLEQLRVAVYCHEALQTQSWDEAIVKCGEVVAMNEASASNQYNLASALMNAGRDEEALAAYEKAIALNPMHGDALLGAGVVAARVGQNEKSQDHLRQYLDLNPGNLQVRLKIAADVAQAGDPRGALALIEEGVDPDSMDATSVVYAGHFALASARELMENSGASGDPANATSLLEKALDYYNRAYTMQGDSAQAAMLSNMLVAYRLLDRNDEAVELGARAVRTQPDDAALWSAYADVLAAAGRRDEAVQALARVSEIDPSYTVNARLGSWQLEAGNLSAAQASFRKAIANNEVEGGDQIARMIFGQGYNGRAKARQYDAAIAYYNVAREFASEAATKGMINFFHGHALFQKALDVQKPSTAASARASLPLFREARRYLEQAGAYTDQAATRTQLLGNIDQYIEIQNALIKRG
jgi:tetratricopeptide (TPR) repeat protein